MSGYVSKSDAIPPIVSVAMRHTSNSVENFATGHFCNASRAFLNQRGRLRTSQRGPEILIAYVAIGAHPLRRRPGPRCCRGPIRRHRGHQVLSLTPESKSRLGTQYRCGVAVWPVESCCAILRSPTLSWALLCNFTYNMSILQLRTVGRFSCRFDASKPPSCRL